MTIIALIRHGGMWLLAAAGVARFEFEMALSHHDRRGRGGDAGKAVYWARRAVAHGSVEARRLLAAFLSVGYGVEKNAVEAARLYQEGANAGDAASHFSLALCYRDGAGVERSLEWAFEHWLQAAEGGHVEAQAAVAECLFTGQGTEADLEMAAEWARLALKNDAADAAELLGRIEAALGATQ